MGERLIQGVICGLVGLWLSGCAGTPAPAGSVRRADFAAVEQMESGRIPKDALDKFRASAKLSGRKVTSLRPQSIQ